jgi:hypothetical protein
MGGFVKDDGEKKKVWPPKAGAYPMDVRVLVNGKFKMVEIPGPSCRHKGRPAEPFLREGQFGVIRRVTAASKGIPAQAYVVWSDEGETWENLSALTS